MQQFYRFAVVLAFFVGSLLPTMVGPASQGEASGLPCPVPAPDWSAQGIQAGAQFGYSVAQAGDVNGDGFGDIIVGAPFYDGGQGDEGRAYVYYGSVSGPVANPWIAESNQVGARLGASVSTAGDVNGDGYADVVIGAPGYDGSNPDAGAALVFTGSAMGLGTTPAWFVEGETGDDAYGTSVSGAGDVNGDGFSDIIVGAPGYPATGYRHGKAYVYLGSSSGLLRVASWNMPADSAHVDTFAGVVSGAGDVNGDGYGDVVVGRRGAWPSNTAFVYLGGVDGLAVVPHWSSPVQGFSAVAAADDVDGDGFADIIIGGHTFYHGFAWLLFGSAEAAVESWSFYNPGDPWRGAFGNPVSSAGDVDGDGAADMLVGGNPQVYLYLGAAGQRQFETRWSVHDDQPGAFYGASVSGAGDVNGDGFGDFLVGAPLYDKPQNSEGCAFLYFGGSDFARPTATPTATKPTPTATRTVPATGTEVFQYGVDGYYGSQHAEINSWYPDQNGGGMQVRAGDKLATLIRFDVSRIPTNATVTQATFSAYATSRFGSQPVNVGAYRVKRRWSSWEATWNNATRGDSWAIPGCNGVPADRLATPGEVVSMYDTTAWYSFDVTDMAQFWVGHPGGNYGLALKSFDATGGVWMASNGHGGADVHPKLTIHYHLPGVPTLTATSTRTRTATSTTTATSTETSVPSATATPTATATATPSATGTAAETPSPTGTATLEPTASRTPSPTEMPSSTPTATPSATALPSTTSTPTATAKKPWSIWLPLVA